MGSRHEYSNRLGVSTISMCSRHGDEAKPAEPQPAVAPEAPSAAFEGDDAAALEAMKAVMSRKPFEARTVGRWVAMPGGGGARGASRGARGLRGRRRGCLGGHAGRDEPQALRGQT